MACLEARLPKCLGARHAPDSERLHLALTEYQIARLEPRLTRLDHDVDRVEPIERDAFDLAAEWILHHQPPICQTILPAPGITDSDEHERKPRQPHEKIQRHHERN